jgi:hypothetical protein
MVFIQMESLTGWRKCIVCHVVKVYSGHLDLITTCDFRLLQLPKTNGILNILEIATTPSSRQITPITKASGDGAPTPTK